MTEKKNTGNPNDGQAAARSVARTQRISDAIRDTPGLTQSKVAKAAGISASAFTQSLKGVRNFQVDELILIEDFLQLNPGSLIRPESTPVTNSEDDKLVKIAYLALGKRIKDCRERAGISLEMAAVRIMSVERLTLIESGLDAPDFLEFDMLANRLNVDPLWLMTGRETK